MIQALLDAGQPLPPGVEPLADPPRAMDMGGEDEIEIPNEDTQEEEQE